MPELSLGCPQCGAANTVPMEFDSESFTCSSCGRSATIADAATARTEEVQDYLVGEVISECRVVAKVGEGGFGSVYKAVDENLERTVALKVMLQSLSSNADYVQKFVREAVTAAQLNHPNIVAIHKVGREDTRGLHYLIMEFVEGETLAERVARDGVYSVSELLPIALQACDALATAHEASIVHRDIKPDNLMLDPSGAVKITDFGLAKSLASEQHTTKVMGTPHYMSPEQFEGKPVDGRSDIYSLGTTFYFLLSRSRPYEGQNTVQIIYSILTQEPKPLTDVAGEAARPIWKIIERMIAKKPEDRYQSLRETMDDLRALTVRAIPDRSQCPGCGAKNPRSRKFCRGCGVALLVVCPACGVSESAEVESCGGCGADLARLLRVGKALEQGARFRELGDLHRAAEVFRAALEIDAENEAARNELASLRETLGELDEVRSDTAELVETGDIEEALRRAEALLERHPDAIPAREHRDEIRKRLADVRVTALMEEVEAAADDGDVRLALERLDAALRIDPDRADVRARRDELGRRIAELTESRQKAVEALAAGRYEDALALASAVLQATPDDAAMADVRDQAQASVASVEGLVAKGRASLEDGGWPDALSRFEAALALRPGDTTILALVDETRERIRGHRERLAECRRQIAEGAHAQAIDGLEKALAAAPGDAEATLLLASARSAAAEALRRQELGSILVEARTRREAGDLMGSVERLEAALDVDERHEEARTLLREVQGLARTERDVRELAREHLQDGSYDAAIEALERLHAVNPARRADVDQEIAEARAAAEIVGARLRDAVEALSAREFRRAAASAGEVLEIAPRHPRATAVKKDADKAVVAIDRFLENADRLILAEMFDDAVEVLDKARERGARGDEHERRRASCEQGRRALLKTDASRALVAGDLEAAIASYEQVLETAPDDVDALRGKRAAERRLRSLTTEPIGLRLGVAAVALLLLGLVQVTAVASTAVAAMEAEAVANFERDRAREVFAVGTGQLAPRIADARAAEAEGDLETALAAYQRELEVEGGKFAGRRELLDGKRFAETVLDAQRLEQPRERLDALLRVGAFLGFRSDVRRDRRRIVNDLSMAAVADWFAAVESLEADDPGRAIALIGEIEQHPVARLSPSLREIKERGDYLDALYVGDDLFSQNPPTYADAVDSYRYAIDEMAGDAARRGVAEERLVALRRAWIDDLRRQADDAPNDEAFFEAIRGLEELARTLGLSRERVLDEFRR